MFCVFKKKSIISLENSDWCLQSTLRVSTAQ